jgi:predicted nucleic acid-binding protein
LPDIKQDARLLELTVQLLRLGRQDAADDYEVLLDYFPNFELVPISREVLLEAASLRARQGLRTPDAIQIPTGLRAGATLAITNDKTWRSVPLIETLLLPDLSA